MVSLPATAPSQTSPAAYSPRPVPDEEHAPLIQLSGFGCRRGDRVVIRDVDLNIRRGEIVALIGPNGGGKSTTAKAIAGILPPDSGHITRAPGLSIGYMAQSLSIDRTVPMTLNRFLTLTQRSSAADCDRVLDLVGLTNRGQTPVQGLSGGEFQRAQLARLLLRNSDLLVLDEPVQGVDVLGEVALYSLIKNIRDSLNCGILLVSHDLHIVMAETDRVYCLNGHVCCSGAPQAVAASPAYRHLFGARAADAIAVYRHDHDHSHDHDHGLVPAHDHKSDGIQEGGTGSANA